MSMPFTFGIDDISISPVYKYNVYPTSRRATSRLRNIFTFMASASRW